MAVDAASHIIGWNVKNGWYPKGRPVTTPVSLSRKRFHSYGALCEDDLLCNFYDKANSESFCDFMGEIHKKFGKAVLVLDNTSVHKSKVIASAESLCKIKSVMPTLTAGLVF